MPAPDFEESKHEDTSDTPYTILIDVSKDQEDESKAASPADDSSHSFEMKYNSLALREASLKNYKQQLLDLSDSYNRGVDPDTNKVCLLVLAVLFGASVNMLGAIMVYANHHQHIDGDTSMPMPLAVTLLTVGTAFMASPLPFMYSCVKKGSCRDLDKRVTFPADFKLQELNQLLGRTDVRITYVDVLNINKQIDRTIPVILAGKSECRKSLMSALSRTGLFAEAKDLVVEYLVSADMRDKPVKKKMCSIM